MTDWSIWFVLAGVAILLELSSGTFYLLMIALGLAAGGIAALAGVLLEWQLLVAAVVGLVGTVGLRRSSLGGVRSKKARQDHNVLLDIGRTVTVSDWKKEGNVYVAQVKYRGAAWQAELVPDSTPVADAFMIVEIRGSTLLLRHVVDQ